MPTKDGHGDCRTCGGRCCRYVVVEIDRPRSKADRDEVRWFLAHENVWVYIDGDDRSWNVQFFTPCRHLDAEGRCRIYRRRFQICREHDTATCEASDGEQTDLVFRTTEDFDRWYRAECLRRALRRRRRAAAKGAAKGGGTGKRKKRPAARRRR